MEEDTLIYKDECYQIVGACMEVHKELGPGFLEAVYQEALELELDIQTIPFISQKPLDIYYKNFKLQKQYYPDFICFDKIVVEIKSVEKLLSEHTAQVLNYLKATGCRLGILINFGQSSLTWKRIIK